MNCPLYNCLVAKGCMLCKMYLIDRIIESYSLHVEARTGKHIPLNSKKKQTYIRVSNEENLHLA